MEMECKIPQLKGFDITKEELIETSRNNEIIRLGIHVSSRSCNFSCPYCLNDEGTHYIDNKLFKQKASLEEMKSWIDEAGELNVRYVVIDGIFEPLLNKTDTYELIKHIRSLDITPILITNMVLIDDETVKILNEYQVSVIGKLNVPIVDKNHPDFNKFSEIQALLTGYTYKNVYELLLEKIDLLISNGLNINISNKKGGKITRLGIETVITPHNYQYIYDLTKQLREKNIFLLAENVKPQGAAKGKDFKVSPCEMEKLNNEVVIEDLKNGWDSGVTTPAYLTGKCTKHIGTFNININGDVIPCPSIELVVGNLKQTSLKDIINNQYIKILRNLPEYIEGDCKSCEYMKSLDCYGGCRGYTFMYMKNKGYSDYDSLIASDPSCWRVNNVLDNDELIKENKYSHLIG